MATKELDTNEILYKLLSERVGAVDPNRVFYATQIQGGKNAGKYTAKIGGKKLTDKQLANLQSEVMLLRKTELWHLFTQTLAHEARLRMFEKAKTTEDMFFGKALLHAIGIFETIAAAIENTMLESNELSTGAAKST